MHKLSAKEKIIEFSDYTPCTRHNEGHGFTLVELLVVMGILSFLVAILLPALTEVRRQARRLIGMNNQKQIVSGVSLFAVDNEDRYPESVATIGFGNNWNWQEPTLLIGDRKRSPRLNRSISAYLHPYIDDASVMFCPNAPREHKYLQEAWDAGEDWGNPDAPMVKGPMIGTYCFYWNYVGFLGGRRGLFRGPRSAADGKMQSKLMVTCYFGYDHWQTRNTYSSCEKFSSADLTEETWCSPSVWYGLNSNTSLDTLNIKLHAGYIDGHVESYGPSEVVPMEVIVKPSTGEPYLRGLGPGIFYLPGTYLH